MNNKEYEQQVSEVFSLEEETEKKEVVETKEEQTTKEEGGDDGLQEKEEVKEKEETLREEAKEEETSVEEKKTGADYAKERIEAKRFKELEAERDRYAALLMQQQKQSVATPPKKEPAIQKNPYDKDIEPENYSLWEKNASLEMELDRVKQQIYWQDIKTRKELAESQAVQANPEYNSQKEFIIQRQAKLLEMQAFDDLRMQYPQATETQIKTYIEENKQFLVNKAKTEVENIILKAFHNKTNINEVVKMYSESFGYMPKPKETEVKKEAPKVDLSVVNKNKAKSSSLNGKGLGAGKSNRIDADRINEMSLDEMLSVNINEIEF